MPEVIFDRIEAALKALDRTSEGRIQAVDGRLRALGLTVETYLAEPADVSNDIRLHLGYARIAGGYGLVIRRIRGEESAVEPLRGADRATRIAVVDKLALLLEAIEAELRRRSAQLGSAEAGRAAGQASPKPATQAAPAASSAPAPGPGAAAATKPAPIAPPGIALPSASEVDAPLHRASGENRGHTAKGSQDSVDHMFRLFSRKGK